MSWAKATPTALTSRLAGIPRDRLAIVEATRQITYGELTARAGALCEELREHGVGPESAVALCIPPGIELVTGVLAVLQAGAAYVPLDPSYPSSRLAHMAADSRSECLLTTKDLAGHLSSLGMRALYVDGGTPDEQKTRSVRVPEGSPGAIAYVIYTSGSTGRPKGVEVTRDGVVRLLSALEQAGVIGTATGRVGWNASASFDASVQQWVRLFRGDTLVPISARLRAEPAELAEFIVEQRLSDLDITPSHLALLLPHLRVALERRSSASQLRLLVGGEAIPPSLWAQLRLLEVESAVRVVNLYGPTECVVDSTAGWLSDSDHPCLGYPLPDVRTYVLGEDMLPVPDGEAGELYIGGPRLARGYRSRPGLTAERFLPDPTASDGSRMYRTGDRVRYREGCRLEYLGRLDNQVKVRGFRVELAEIEVALHEVSGIDQAVVLLRDDLPGGPGLVAYCRATDRADPAQLRESLRSRLPDFMLPSVFVMVDRFPLNANGKVDRHALPTPTEHRAGRSRHAYIPPATPIETLLVKVWSEVLGAETVSADANFFQVGGHSILAIRVVAELKKEARTTIPMAAVFEHPRLRDLAAYVERQPPIPERTPH
jgi:amino acid adenylation domain-containing protein